MESEEVQESKVLSSLSLAAECTERRRPKISCVTLLFLGIGTLAAAIIAPNFIRARAQGRMGPACKSNLKNIGTAMEMYSTDWEGTYPSKLAALTPEYLRTIPTCPDAGGASYKMDTGAVAYNKTLGYNDYYIVWCGGPNHTSLSVPAGYPQYDGLRGLYER